MVPSCSERELLPYPLSVSDHGLHPSWPAHTQMLQAGHPHTCASEQRPAPVDEDMEICTTSLKYHSQDMVHADKGQGPTSYPVALSYLNLSCRQLSMQTQLQTSAPSGLAIFSRPWQETKEQEEFQGISEGASTCGIISHPLM